MPITAAFIDDLRERLGAEAVTQAMREGLRDGDFFAIEGEHIVGRPTREAYLRCGLEPPADAPLEEPGYPAIAGNIAHQGRA